MSVRAARRCPNQVLVGHVACLGHGGGGHASWHCRTCDAVVYGPPLSSHCTALQEPATVRISTATLDPHGWRADCRFGFVELDQAPARVRMGKASPFHTPDCPLGRPANTPGGGLLGRSRPTAVGIEWFGGGAYREFARHGWPAVPPGAGSAWRRTNC